MARRCFSFRLIALSLPFALGGCGMFDWATANMPVIGQRCENWQCFTESGQQQSKMNAEERQHPAENPMSSPLSPVPGGQTAPAATAQPAAPSSPPTATPAPQYEPTPEGGAYKYVPRGPAAPGTTPFDGAIPPLGPQ